jgi:hypothetical protein
MQGEMEQLGWVLLTGQTYEIQGYGWTNAVPY